MKHKQAIEAIRQRLERAPRMNEYIYVYGADPEPADREGRNIYVIRQAEEFRGIIPENLSDQ